MNFDEYQEQARATAIYDKKYAILYPTLGIAGESGEVAEKIKKVYRDNDGVVSEEKKKEITKELGDILWYIANLASDLNISLELIAFTNIEKLNSRKERGVLQGSGDNR